MPAYKYLIIRYSILPLLGLPMARRDMYRKERLDAFLGFNVSLDMNSEIEAEAEHALYRKSDFLRILLQEGLKGWRLAQLRAGRGVPNSNDGLAASRAAAKRGE
jgi:hypothetical protein